MTTPRLALETTLLAHGVPRGAGLRLARELTEITAAHGAAACFVGVHAGTPTAALDWNQLVELLDSPDVPKANTANLGVLLHQRRHAATTVSTTMELAAAAGIRVFATGGLGGVHRGYGTRLDISSDLTALTRFPVAVVASGVKSLLDVESTREALETLGVPVVGYRTDAFPAFYQGESAARVDARFDDDADLARFLDAELRRTGRGVLVCQPVPTGDAIAPERFAAWLREAQARAAGAAGRDVTPAVLAALHEVSGGATLRANLALVRANAALGARLASALSHLTDGTG